MSVLSQEASQDSLAGVELSPALKAVLLDGSAWRKGLENFAQAANLAVALVDAEGRLVMECLNPRPTWSMLHARSEPRPEGSCPFALTPLAPCTCHADALAQGAIVTATNGVGLVHFAVPLVLEGHCLGALLAGQVFTQYPEQMAVEWMAAKLGLKSGAAWALARQEFPVKQATLRVYAGLLASLGQNFLENRFHVLMERERLAEMTRLRDHAVAETAERRRVEADLRASEQLFRQLVQDVKDYAIILLDPLGHVASWNEGAERILGYRAEEITGQHFARFFTPEDREAGKPEHELAMAEREGRLQFDYWLVREDESRFWASGVTTAMRNEAGGLRGFAQVMQDATARKHAEETLQEADRRKNEFLAMLAHELRNPLAPILTSLQIMRLAEQRDQREQAREIMERQVRYMVRLIDDLLDVSRISRGKVELRLERVELATVVQSALETSRPLVDARGHELTVTLPTEPLWLDADAMRLAQVLANLINNAAKYTPNGGHIWLTAGREDKETRRPGGKETGSVVMRVRDTGLGISAEMLPRVFELFTQADRSLDRAQGGLGIGLTVARSLVEMHGGSLSAASEGSGRGSEFAVHLPLAAERSAVRETEKKDEEQAPADLRILVVDDNRDAVQSLSTLLQLMGHEVRCAYEGPAAVTAAVEYLPDLVLLDIGLPGMSGYEVACRIREQPSLRNTVLTALTGWGAEEDRCRSRDAGFDHHLVKPVDSESLVKLLAEVGSSKA